MQARPLSPAALHLLGKHSWPGNIRELENLIERYVILGSEDAISSEILNWEHTHATPEIPLEGQIHLKKVTRQAVHDLERKIILSVLEANRWNRKRTAVALKSATGLSCTKSAGPVCHPSGELPLRQAKVLLRKTPRGDRLKMPKCRAPNWELLKS